MSEAAGRACPLRYRYGAEAIARAPVSVAETLYVVGGLYGNLPALATIEAMAAAEPGPVNIIFNGDFNWFNIDDAGFAEINRRVLEHRAILGNVEAELGADGADAGCGCAYPAQVDDAVVARSNAIHARLKATAARHPQLVERLARLPMFARFVVGDCRIGIVHGDADSLAGWQFAVDMLDAPGNQPWLADVFTRAEVDLFASSHTCLPALRHCGEAGLVINNGAAGMPNFRGQTGGLLTRIASTPPNHPALYGTTQRGVNVDALPIDYNNAEWDRQFLANWPPGSPAWCSYYPRISRRPDHDIERAAGNYFCNKTPV